MPEDGAICKRRFTIRSRDGCRLALWKLSAAQRDTPQTVRLLFCHGLFSNMRALEGAATFFACQGCVSWILEWRGHGHSERPKEGFTLETAALLDVPSAIEQVHSQDPDRPLFWIGHSGGGLVIAMALARRPELQSKLRGLIFVASQAWSAAATPLHILRLHALRAATNAARGVPGKLLRLGPHNESAFTMNPWYRWNIRREFTGAGGFDYREGLSSIELPVLSVAGSGDWLIAPPQACKAFLSELGSPNKTFIECGTSHGYLEDYSHSRLMHSHSASLEIWPLLAAWIGMRDRNQGD